MNKCHQLNYRLVQANSFGKKTIRRRYFMKPFVNIFGCFKYVQAAVTIINYTKPTGIM